MTIKEFTINRKYKYLWLKYVTGFNLDVHCARCLLGNYSTQIGVTQLKSGRVENIVLNEFEYRYIYLCGVTVPYVWKDNLHLALEYCKGETVDYSFNNDIHIVVENARQIPIEKLPVYDHQKGHLAEYNTCRNWQFAFQQNKNQ